MSVKRHKISILGVNVDDISLEGAVKTILQMAKAKKRGNVLVTVNSEFVMFARRSSNFSRILNSANLVVADGQWVVWAKLIFGGREHERVAGVDLVEKLCEICADKPISVGFLGGFEGVAELAKKRQIAQNPGLKVVFAEPGDPSIGYDLRLKRQLSAIGGVDILFVAYGMGQQEFWIDRVKNKLPVGVFMGVGGAFDYISGVKKRAPKLFQKLGIEYLWRLFWEPFRAGRMLRVFPLFWVLVFWEKFRNKS